MSAKTKYPTWFDHNRQPYFFGLKPNAVNITTTLTSTNITDGKYDHVVYENEDIKVVADIIGYDDDFQLEVRTYKKDSTPNEKYESELEVWKNATQENEARLLEWPGLRDMKLKEMKTERDRQEYLRLKKIFQPAEK